VNTDLLIFSPRKVSANLRFFCRMRALISCGVYYFH